MNRLTFNGFSSFFRAIHGVDPFPWQTELARQVLEKGRWPSLLDMPTGTGKTATIDIAVFHLACEADKGPSRRAPLRTLFVIDRRIVVDAAFERAVKISKALLNSQDPVVKAVAERLSILSGDPNHPLDVVRLRGGVPQERDWARSPSQPLVAVSTVDQVGSRLLFRGYGVSPRMRPVHAGLVGTDALWLLDEVHLSRPFEETLDAITACHGESAGWLLCERSRLAPFAVVKLSATPGKERPADSFPSADFDICAGAPQTFLDRLKAHKWTTLTEMEGDPADAFVHHALRLAGLRPDTETQGKKETRKKAHKAESDSKTNPVRRVAVVVNRVALARRVFEIISRETGCAAETLLLTGRVRPLDRDRILKKLEPLVAAMDRPQPEKPIIIVATQTIEAGADLDVDALVTEIAPLDSLRRRFGRLDRLGLRGDSRAVIIYPPGKPVKKEGDNPWTPLTRIYGDAVYNTKVWLAGMKGEIDFGVDYFQGQMDSLDSGKLESMLAPKSQAPVLLPPYVDLWATTSPTPLATPEPSIFLHGPGNVADVQLVWRADIDPAKDEAARISLALCPPSALESLSLPVWAVKSWLEQRGAESDFADVPEKAFEGGWVVHSRGLPVMLRDGEGWKRGVGRDIKPGSTVVVPARYGGCDRWGWAPSSKAEVVDLGAEAHYRQRFKGALPLSFATLANALDNDEGAEGKNIADEIWKRIENVISEAEDDVDAESIRSMLATEGRLPEVWQRLLSAMERRRVEITFFDEQNRRYGFVLHARKGLEPNLLDLRIEDMESGAEAITDRDDSSNTGTNVALTEHLEHVERRARDFASRAGMDERHVELVALAARHHDLGKADPRFQLDLRGASTLVSRDPALAALMLPDGKLLAKSERTEKGSSVRTRRLRAAPLDFRHEALSVALAEKHPEIASLSEEERDLVLWLIGTHHGFGRPFFPPCSDPAPQTKAEVEIGGITVSAVAREAPLRLDQGWFELAERLRRRYGPWELARLEAILRLADHAASAEEQEITTSNQSERR